MLVRHQRLAQAIDPMTGIDVAGGGFGDISAPAPAPEPQLIPYSPDSVPQSVPAAAPAPRAEPIPMSSASAPAAGSTPAAATAGPTLSTWLVVGAALGLAAVLMRG